MENKRKNVYIIIFVVTTVIASCVAVYFGLQYKRTEEDDLKQEASVKENNTQVVENSENKGEATVKEVVKETQLSQENIDKIAKATIEKYFEIVNNISSSTTGEWIVDIGLYNSEQEYRDNVKVVDNMEVTTVKYDDFINQIAKIMTKEMFENGRAKFGVYKDKFKNVDGYLAVEMYGATGSVHHIKSLKLKEKKDQEFSYDVTYYYCSMNDYTNNNCSITIKKVNDNYVVSSIVDN